MVLLPDISNRPLAKDTFMEAVRTFYSDWGTMDRAIPNFALIRQYVRGEQSTLKYKKRLSIDEHDGQHDDTINWRPVSVIDPIQRIASARIMRKEQHVVAVPVDARAQDEENEWFASMKARLMLREALLAEGGDVDMLPRIDGEPETVEELEVLVANGIKHRLAKDYEDAVQAVAAYSALDEQRDEAVRQLFHYGYAAWKHYIDDDGLLRVRLIPEGKLIAPRTSYLDFSDAPAIGEEMELSMAELRALYPDMTAEEERQLRGRYDVRHGTDRVTVVYMEVRGAELLGIERRVTSYGAEVVRYRRNGSGNVASIRMDKVYGGYWIVDTDICFSFGEVPYTPRQVSSFDKARFTYVVRAVSLVNGVPKGLAVDAIPYVDQFHLAWYKLQQTIATMRPNAIFIAAEALIGVPLRDKDKPVNAAQLLNLFAEKNVLVGRMRDEFGRASSGPPAISIANNSDREFMTLRNVMFDMYDNVRRLYGLNAITDASTPDPKILTTPARLADQGTSNALYVIERSDRLLTSSLYQGVADRIAVMMARNSRRMKEFLNRVIGKGSVLIIRNSAPFYLYDVGITIMDSPNVEERQGLEEAMAAAVREGMLTPADIAFVRTMGDPSQAADVLAIRVARNRRRAEEQSLRLQQMNAMVQQQSAVQAHEMKMQEMKAKADLEIYVWQNTRALELQQRAEVDAAKVAIEAYKADASNDNVQQTKQT